MPLATFALLLALAPQAPLPVLRTEATDGGSIFYVKNVSSQPLLVCLIELVNYPGSFYMLWQDDSTEPVAPGAEKRIRVTNMTVGAVPDYVKLQAALYADGSTSGVPERVAQLLERRRFLLQTARELIGRLEKPGPTLVPDLKQWAGSLPEPTRATRNTQAAINSIAGKGLIAAAVAQVESKPLPEALAAVRAWERAFAKP